MNIASCCLIGGKSVGEDVKKLEGKGTTESGNPSPGMQIISGTPGRLNHLIAEKVLETKYVKLLIVDESDEMLQRGFMKQVHDIIKKLHNFQMVSLIFLFLLKKTNSLKKYK